MNFACGVVALLAILIQQEDVAAQGLCVESCTGVTNGDYQSCTSCEKYITCSNDQTFERPCVATLEWDDDKKICDTAPSPTCSACSLDSSPCPDVGSECTVNTGSGPAVTCTCSEGFTGNGTECTELQEESTLSSCSDVLTLNASAPSDIYTIKNDDGQLYSVYCDFYLDHVYTYIAPTNLTSLNISEQFTSQRDVLLRYRLTSGEQFEVKIEQLPRYRARDISIQYNMNAGHGDIQNTQMGPYLYVGLLPNSGIRQLFDIQGYTANTITNAFVNCNGSPYTYFALLFNDAGANFTSFDYDDYQYERWLGAFSRSSPFYRQTAEKWFYESMVVAPERELPVELFSQFEIRMGGCGGYVTSELLPTVAGMTIGFKSDVEPTTTTPIPSSGPAKVTNPPGLRTPPLPAK